VRRALAGALASLALALVPLASLALAHVPLASLALAHVPTATAAADVTSAPVRHVRVGDVSLAYRSIGRGAPVVMIMGLGGTMDAWLPELVQRIGAGRRVVLFDNRGTGRSSAGRKPITVTTMAGDTDRLIHALHLGRPDVVGWSMGGFIAQRLVLGHPRDVDHLVLAATSGGGPTATLPRPDAVATLVGGGFPLSVVGLLFPLPSQQAAAAFYARSIVRWSEFDLSVPPDVLTAQLATSLAWFAHGAAFRRIRARTLVGGGLEDELIPPANERVLARGIPGAKLVLYPDAAHGFLAQDWRSFARHVTRLFRGS
jgi:pimeloyl-ACP methyl ester carboxylesterase